jgi:hypothetical protein
MVAHQYSSDANGSGGPKSENLRSVPASVALVLGGLFIYGAVKLLSYAFDGSDRLFMIAFLGGLIPFALGVTLILCCFLTLPPTIFGFSVGHIPLPWLD